MKNFKKISSHLLIIGFLVVPILISAATGQGTPKPPTEIPIKIDNPFNCGGTEGNNCTIMTLIVSILNNIIMPIAAVGIVLFIIYSGFKFVMAQGNPGEIQKAKERLLWGLLGAGILLGAAGIAKVVENTVNKLIAP